jgi:hypothetical protein
VKMDVLWTETFLFNFDVKKICINVPYQRFRSERKQICPLLSLSPLRITEGFHGSHKTRLAGGLVTFPRSPSVLKGDRYLDRVLFPTDPGEFDKAKGIYSATRFCFIIAAATLKSGKLINALFIMHFTSSSSSSSHYPFVGVPSRAATVG